MTIMGMLTKTRRITLLTAGVFFLSVLRTPAQTRHNVLPLSQFSESLQDLSSKISPSVVQIVVSGFGFENDSSNPGVSILSKQRSTGSGVIVSEDGYVVTNAHVVDGARTIHVKLNGSHKGRYLMRRSSERIG
jgi:S1-C subfamily serine protease